MAAKFAVGETIKKIEKYRKFASDEWDRLDEEAAGLEKKAGELRTKQNLLFDLVGLLDRLRTTLEEVYDDE